MSIPHGPQIRATVDHAHATVNVGTRVVDLESADHDDLVRRVLLTAADAAKHHGRPLHMSVDDEHGTTTLLIHPDGTREPVTPAAPAAPVEDLITTVPPARAPLADRTHAATTATAPPPARSEPIPAPVEPDIARTTRRELRQSFLTQTVREEPATRGWRAVLRLAPSAAERAERADVQAVSQHWPGPRTIAVVNPKGGAGKTPSTILLAAVFAHYGGAGVLAWDNNQTRGTLGWRTEQGPHEATLHDLLPEVDRLLGTGAQSADLAHFVHHQTRDRFDVLRSKPTVLADAQRIEPEDVDALHAVAAKYYRLVILDSGNDESDPMWRRMIDHTDQLVVATTTRDDHAEAGALLLEALAERNDRGAQLAAGAVAIVTQADPRATRRDVNHITSGFTPLARQVVTIPHDPAMVDGLLRHGALRTPTQRAWLAAAAAVAEGL